MAGFSSSSRPRTVSRTAGIRGKTDVSPRTCWLRKAVHSVEATPDVDERARRLTGFGFGPLDALHLALAEKAEARWFVTTDDRLLRKAVERRDQLCVEVMRPDQLPLDQENEQ